MMAPNIKISKAYKAMKAMGYTTQTVKPILKNLLDLYDQNWELIEDERYKVLVEAIIESEECKENKTQQRESRSMTSAKLERAYRTMQALGYSQDVVEPVLKSLLDLYDQNWQHIEDEQYKVLVEAIFEKQGSKDEEKTQEMYQISYEHLEDTSPRRSYMLKHQMLHTSPSDNHSSPNFSEAANRKTEYHGKRKVPDSVCYVEDTIIEARILRPLKSLKKEDCSDSQNCYLELDLTKKDDVQPDEEIDESDPQSAEMLHIHDSENDFYGSMEPKKKSALDEYQAAATKDMEQSLDDRLQLSLPPEVILPGQKFDGNTSNDYSSNKEETLSSPPPVIYLECPDKPCCVLGGHCSECKCLVSAEGKKNPLYPTQLDIASSSNGEAKISIICKYPLGSTFGAPNLEAVSRKMEKDFLQSYGFRQSGFSMWKFMKDVCECFLAASAIPTDNNVVRVGTFLSDLGMTKKFESQDVLIGSPNHEIGLCMASHNSPEAQMSVNHVELVPQIPRLLGLNFLDLSRCKIDLPPIGVYDDMCASPNPPNSRSMMIVQETSYHQETFTYHIEDITRGEENLKVSLINEFNNECQLDFKYIPRNISFQKACVQFPLARISGNASCPNCTRDCLSLEKPCNCASETCGSFAYTPEGFVKDTFLEDCISLNQSPEQHSYFYCKECPLERFRNKSSSEKCRGHLQRKFIKECWYKCGCGMECGNRVVQRGIKFKLQVFMTSEGKGWGLRTLEELPKGAFVCEYVGEVVTNTELYERNMKSTGKKLTYPVLLDADWGTGVLRDDDALCLDATFYGNVARFINHRCHDANLVEIPVEMETPNHRYYHVAFFTTRKINALEELTWDYGIDFDDDTHPVKKAFHCSCGSQFCRNARPLKRRKIKL